MLKVMPFYYLFIPTWFFTIIIYTFLAGRYGARQSYPEAETEEKRFNEKVERYQQKLAKEEPALKKDHSITSKLLRAVSFISLGITLILAINVLAGSGNDQYLANRKTFYFYGFICTVVYFVTAYWAMLRGKKRYDSY
jgi:hypothetical protein